MRAWYVRAGVPIALGLVGLFAARSVWPTLIRNVAIRGEPGDQQAEVLGRVARPESSTGVAGGHHALPLDQGVPPDSQSVLIAEPAGVDAGTVLKGESLDYVFTLKNPGSKAVTITAKPTCGCTVAQFDAVIPAGGTGRVMAQIKTAGLHAGRLRKSVKVTTDEPNAPVLLLRLQATLVPAVELLPESAPVIVLKDKGPTVRELYLAMRGPGEVNGVDVRVPYLTVGVDPIDLAALPAGGIPTSKVGTAPDGPAIRGAYRVRLDAGADAPLGRRRIALVVSTSDPHEPTVNLTITCEKGIQVNPSVVYLAASRSDNPRVPSSRIVTLTKRGGTFRIQDVVISDPNLEVRTETVRERSEYRLFVSYRGAEPDNGRLRTSIRIETDDPAQPRIEIPVVAVARPVAVRRQP